MRFEGKVALVTGSSRGIGKAVALAFAREGANVAVNYSVSGEKADEVVREIEGYGRDAIAVKCDVSDESQVRKMVDTAVERFGRLDILVNAAGIVKYHPFMEMKLEEWNRTFDVNITGQFLCSKYAAVQMQKQKSGNIINIASIDGINGYDKDTVDYAATKAAVISFTKTLAWALGPDIRVNCVAPGWVSTDMTADLTEDQIEEEMKRQVIKRFSMPEEQANAVLFLASDDASYVTGSVLVVDGGYQ